MHQNIHKLVVHALNLEHSMERKSNTSLSNRFNSSFCRFSFNNSVAFNSAWNRDSIWSVSALSQRRRVRRISYPSTAHNSTTLYINTTRLSSPEGTRSIQQSRTNMSFFIFEEGDTRTTILLLMVIFPFSRLPFNTSYPSSIFSIEHHIVDIKRLILILLRNPFHYARLLFQFELWFFTQSIISAE